MKHSVAIIVLLHIAYKELIRLMGFGPYADCDVDCIVGYHQYLEELNPDYDERGIFDTNLFHRYYHEEWVQAEN